MYKRQILGLRTGHSGGREPVGGAEQLPHALGHLPGHHGVDRAVDRQQSLVDPEHRGLQLGRVRGHRAPEGRGGPGDVHQRGRQQSAGQRLGDGHRAALRPQPGVHPRGQTEITRPGTDRSDIRRPGGRPGSAAHPDVPPSCSPGPTPEYPSLWARRAAGEPLRPGFHPVVRRAARPSRRSRSACPT